eukprot:TRINITY_DN3328_c4_g1_i1.p2 TRINITY_DN3328_c4_g1~~TRINITY_DN3328_c4_g1_i1.p2  ORF type:complete len:53 (+),score=4.13 TRINITY_DN3328_c4_g1_i1:30-188(+)
MIIYLANQQKRRQGFFPNDIIWIHTAKFQSGSHTLSFDRNFPKWLFDFLSLY